MPTKKNPGTRRTGGEFADISASPKPHGIMLLEWMESVIDYCRKNYSKITIKNPYTRRTGLDCRTIITRQNNGDYYKVNRIRFQRNQKQFKIVPCTERTIL